MKKTIQIIVLAALCLNLTTKAQQPAKSSSIQKGYTGRVVSASSGESLPGAIIKINPSNQTLITNDRGEFSLNLPDGSYDLSVHYLSYKAKTLTVQIPLKESLIISLDTDEQDLQEVEIVSTGYQNIPKERATGSFTQIDNKSINRNVGVNILDRLEGIASGLLLNRGLPTQGGANNAKIAVRGRSTIFASAEPTIVLDGFPYNGTIEQINPADVSTITILKDAAAASIWGAKASNGVIVITTKKGKRNQKLAIEVSSALSVTDKPDLYYSPQISSQDMIDLQQYLFSRGFYTNILNAGYSPVPPAVEVFNDRKTNKLSAADSAFKIDAMKTQDVRADLLKYAYRSSVYQQHHISFRGGTEHNDFYLSGGYDTNLENTVTNSYDRLTLKGTNSLFLWKDKLTLSSGISFSAGNVISQSAANIYTPYTPYDKLVDENGNSMAVVTTTGLRPAFINNLNPEMKDWSYRPKDELTGNNTTRQDQYAINLALNYKIVAGLNLEARYQYLKEHNNGSIHNPIESYYTRNLINRYTTVTGNTAVSAIPSGSILESSLRNLQSNMSRLQMNYQKAFTENHELNALMGFEMNDSRTSSNVQTLYGYDPETLTHGNSTINPLNSYKWYYGTSSGQISTAPSLGGTININRSFYALASYVYCSKYILSASARRDESNLFGVKTNQKGVPLWSAGISWNLGMEDFYNISWLPSLKLRATYGYNGNVDKTVSGLLTVRRTIANEWGSNYSTIQNPPNPGIRWERVRTWNLGLDYIFQGDRIKGSIDVYRKYAEDLIGNSPIAGQSGVAEFRGNNANTLAKGIDASITSNNIAGTLSWSTTLLFNYTTDKVTSYKAKQTSNSNIVSTNFNNPLEGYPYYAIFSFPSAGLDGTGAPQGFLNNEITKNYTAIRNLLDPSQIKFHGSASPKYFGSIINTFSFRDIELSFNILYKLDYYFRRTGVFNGNGTTAYTALAGYEKRWQKAGDELTTYIPALVYPDNFARGAFFQSSDHLVEKGDHIRLQDIRLSYQLGGATSFTKAIKRASVFLYAKNLGILWRRNDLNIDPDYGTVTNPQPFSATVGLNINF